MQVNQHYIFSEAGLKGENLLTFMLFQNSMDSKRNSISFFC